MKRVLEKKSMSYEDLQQFFETDMDYRNRSYSELIVSITTGNGILSIVSKDFYFKSLSDTVYLYTREPETTCTFLFRAYKDKIYLDGGGIRVNDYMVVELYS